MSAAALPILCRLLLTTVCSGPSKGERIVSSQVTTNSTRVYIGELHMLARKGWITYEDNDSMRSLFGARFWDVQLTDKGRSELERVIRDYEARDANQTQCDPPEEKTT